MLDLGGAGEFIGLFAGALTTLSFLPQALKVYRTRSARDLSLAMFLLFWLGIVLWIVYGVLLGSLAIILANIATLLLASAILWFKLRFG
ncbi:SemiSWEET transporter [Rhodospirillaceae bacterium SYSU D60014]|uniref:SemiSWEET transporter n=1 Tax=Virgifigura deserti TaxID=2268457 RepID=UPI000E66C7B6